MKYIRFVRCVACYKLLDKKHIEEIRLELNIFNLTEKLTEYRNKWKQHLERIMEAVFLNQDYKLTGKRNVGKS